jgi:hypothetical protein
MQREFLWCIVSDKNFARRSPHRRVQKQRFIHVGPQLWRQLHEARKRVRLVKLEKALCQLEFAMLPDRAELFLTQCGARAVLNELAKLCRGTLPVAERPRRWHDVECSVKKCRVCECCACADLLIDGRWSSVLKEWTIRAEGVVVEKIQSYSDDL